MENSKEKCGCKNCCCGSNCECNEVSELATGPIMYEGKAKQLFPTANDDELLEKELFEQDENSNYIRDIDFNEFS